MTGVHVPGVNIFLPEGEDVVSEPRTCQSCGAPAQVCDECRRACALKWFSGISRHPEGGTGCLVCEDGLPVWCGTCWAIKVQDYRDELREVTGRYIGHWPNYPDSDMLYEQQLKWERLLRRAYGEEDASG